MFAMCLKDQGCVLNWHDVRLIYLIYQARCSFTADRSHTSIKTLTYLNMLPSCLADSVKTRLNSMFISVVCRSISASQTEDGGDRHVLPHRDIQPVGLWHSRLLTRQRYDVRQKYKVLPWWWGRSVHGDLSWQLKDTELPAWLRG